MKYNDQRLSPLQSMIKSRGKTPASVIQTDKSLPRIKRSAISNPPSKILNNARLLKSILMTGKTRAVHH
jgi:hypothetical protein